MFTSSKILITGGTGSFGQVAVKKFLLKGAQEIIVFSRDENKQEEMRIASNNNKIKYVVGDIRDYNSLHDAMNEVDYVFHAAALKQVPSCEFYPMEAIKTNILGSDNVVRAAISKKVKKVVLLSTDKAVYPINAMGLSKSLMEKTMIANSRKLSLSNDTVLCATRYGNVMGSRGSVIPLFIKQIQENKNITITDPLMTRFLMSLEDSFDLVCFALQNAKQGDIFVQKGKSSTIENLAISLKELFNSKNKIDVIGTRHGEKLFETLISREEMVNAEDMETYYRLPSDNRDLNYNQYFSQGEINVSKQEDYTSHNTNLLNIEQIKRLLLTINYVKEHLDV